MTGFLYNACYGVLISHHTGRKSAIIGSFLPYIWHITQLLRKKRYHSRRTNMIYRNDDFVLLVVSECDSSYQRDFIESTRYHHDFSELTHLGLSFKYRSYFEIFLAPVPTSTFLIYIQITPEGHNTIIQINRVGFRTWIGFARQILIKFETSCIEGFFGYPFEVPWGRINACMLWQPSEHSSMHRRRAGLWLCGSAVMWLTSDIRAMHELF